MHSARVLVLSAAVALLVLGHGTALARQGTDDLKISGVEVINTSQTSATIFWTTGRASSSKVNFGTDVNNLRFSVFDPALTTHHSAFLTGLKPNTPYFFQVQAVDAHDNATTEDNKGKYYSLTTLISEKTQRSFAGVVVSGPAAVVTLYQESTGEMANIILGENYALDTPGGLRAGAFKIGAQAVILGQLVDNNWVALRVLVKPLLPATPVTGVITSVQEGVVTLTSSDGTVQTLTPTNNVDELTTGDLVTVFPGPANPATGIVKAEIPRERLGKFLEAIALGEEQDLQNPFRARQANFLIQVLEKHLAYQRQIIEDVLRWASEDVQNDIRRTRTEIDLFVRNSQSITARIRAKFGLEDEGDVGGREQKDRSGQGNLPEIQDQGAGNSQGQSNTQNSQDQGAAQDNPGQGQSNTQNSQDQGAAQDNPGQGQSNAQDNSGQGQSNAQDNSGQGQSAAQNSRENGNPQNGQRQRSAQDNPGQGAGRDRQGQGSGKNSQG